MAPLIPLQLPGLASYLVPFVHPSLHLFIFLCCQQQLCSHHRLGLYAGWAVRDIVINRNDESLLTWSSLFEMTPQHSFCICSLTQCILTKEEGLIPYSLASSPWDLELSLFLIQLPPLGVGVRVRWGSWRRWH